MKNQLGITKLRHGPSGNPKDANAANTDESKANPYPNLPKLMQLNNGKEVTTTEGWWNQRRPEIVEHFEREVVGRIPENTPKIKRQLYGHRCGTAGISFTGSARPWPHRSAQH